MKKTHLIPAALAALLAASGAFGADDLATTGAPAPLSGAALDAAPAHGTSADAWHGTIVETMDAAGYTYAQIDTGLDKLWVAAPEAAVKVGDRVSVPRGMAMNNFVSKTLDRTFDQIYFVAGIYPEAAAAGAGGPAPMSGGESRAVVTDAHVERLPKVEGGYTVEEILAQSAELAGQTVKVRGRVVKFVPNIMGTNWMHIQDGAGGDLAVTTDATVAKGDQVLVEGELSANKNFGAGYSYPAIIEKARVEKE